MKEVHPFTIPDQALALTLNGQLANPASLEERAKQHTKHIAVDGGLRYYLIWGIIPDLIFGDGDSTPQSLAKSYASIPNISLPRHKDDSDFAIALNHVKQKESVSRITIFAGTGRRIDHTLLNLITAKSCNLPLFFESDCDISFFITEPSSIIAPKGTTLSLTPFPQALGVSSSGLKWELQKQDLNQDFFSLSNITQTDRVDIDLKEGCLLVTAQSSLSPS